MISADHPNGSQASLFILTKTRHVMLKTRSDQDTVPVGQSSDWRHPPFDAVLDNEFLYGRGVVDCKNLLIAIMEAIEALLGTDYSPSRTILLSFGFDEELVRSNNEGSGHLARRVIPYMSSHSYVAAKSACLLRLKKNTAIWESKRLVRSLLTYTTVFFPHTMDLKWTREAYHCKAHQIPILSLRCRPPAKKATLTYTSMSRHPAVIPQSLRNTQESGLGDFLDSLRKVE